ncbi:MAG: lytic transglycosylase [Candidatus Pacearchaeota archaeon]
MKNHLKKIINFLLASSIFFTYTAAAVPKSVESIKPIPKEIKDISMYQEWLDRYELNNYNYSSENFYSCFQRMEKYRNIIEKAAKESRLPVCELEALIAIESCGLLKAHSKAGASGPAQLMYGKAKEFGIKITSTEDWRYSVDSIFPAAKYFAKVKKNYGLENALIAYNAGESKANNINHLEEWEDKRDYIPYETQKYVPRFMNAAVQCLEYEEERKNHVKIAQKGDTLWKIAKECKSNVEKIKKINGISGKKIFSGQKIVCSEDYFDIFAKATFYTVKTNDTMAKIARKYGISPELLKYLNPQIKKFSNLTPGMKIRIIKSE